MLKIDNFLDSETFLAFIYILGACFALDWYDSEDREFKLRKHLHKALGLDLKEIEGNVAGTITGEIM